MLIVWLIGVLITGVIALILVYIGNKILNKMKIDNVNSEMEMKLKKESMNPKEKMNE